MTVTFESMPCLLARSLYQPLSTSGAHNLKVLDHAGNDLFATPLTSTTWHRFAVQADWDNLNLGVLYSSNNAKLTTITDVLQNPTASLGATSQGGAAEHLSCIQFEKLLLVDLNHHGILPDMIRATEWHDKGHNSR